jgi:two-component sensor histidine kinase
MPTSFYQDPPAPSEAESAARTISVRSLLLLLVLLIVIPPWGFAGYVSWRYALSGREMIATAGRTTARNIAGAVDFRLTSIESSLATLALSPALRNGDIAAFYKDAEALAATQRVVVALVSAQGEQILNTNAPYGQKLPPAAPESRYAEAISTGRTQFSKMLFGHITQRWLVAITMPVPKDGQSDRVLVVGLDTLLHLGEVLATIDVPGSWTIAILDDDRNIAARMPNPEPYVGKKSHPDVLKVVTEAPEGTGLSTTISGEPVHLYYSRHKRAAWLTLVGIPKEDVDGTVRIAVMPVMLMGLSVLLSSLLAAWMLGSRFTRQLVAIARYASAFRSRRRGPSVTHSRIAELVELQNSLETAAAERNRYEKRLRGLIADKDMLMQEVHHRVKNSLQLVRGVLSLQARATDHPATKAALTAAASRIMTVADVHQHLYQGHSTAEIHVGRYIEDLAKDLATSLIGPDSARHIHARAADVIWPSEKATTLGLIITELVTNAIKYGEGDVSITFSIGPDGDGELVVEDQGKGFPEDFGLGRGTGLGSKLVTSLIREEEGSITIDRSVPFGRVVLAFRAGWRSAVRGE